MDCTNCDTPNVSESPDPTIACCSAAWRRFEDAKALGTMFSAMSEHDWQVTRNGCFQFGNEHGLLLKLHSGKWMITGRANFPGVFKTKREPLEIIRTHLSREALRRSLIAQGVEVRHAAPASV